MTAHKNKNSGWPILGMFVLFFATFCCVDAYFVYKALSTNTGIVEKDYYKRGLEYDRILQQAKNQESYASEVIAEQDLLQFSLLNAAGVPIEKAIVSAQYMRPVGDKTDFTVDLAVIQDGRYESAISLPQRGAWIIRIKATWLDPLTQKRMNYQIERPFLAK